MTTRTSSERHVWQSARSGDLRALLRLGRALIEQYCASFRHAPKRIVLDIDAQHLEVVQAGRVERLAVYGLVRAPRRRDAD
jgi:very-short-patch-repair endonuclease